MAYPGYARTGMSVASQNPTGIAVANGLGANFALVWGTDLFRVGSFTTALIKSITYGERNEPVSIENGSGLTAIFLLIKDGGDFDINLLDNAISGYNPPSGGDTLTFLNPFTGMPGATCICVAPKGEYARKQEGTLTITGRSFTLINTGN
jgi:hypothetical protein